MIQFNLLPDIKLATIKSERLKRTVIFVSTLAGAICLGILIILYLTINVSQKSHLNNLNKEIGTNISKLQSTPNLSQILKVQAQLNALPALHAEKPVTTRIAGYLAQLTPNTVTISGLSLNFSLNTMTITGSADSVATINTYVDTLKFSTYQIAGSTNTSTALYAFPTVKLTSFTYSSATPATYTINVTFDPAIFSAANSVTLTVPTKITTRSELDQPNVLFQSQTTSSNNAATSQ